MKKYTLITIAAIVFGVGLEANNTIANDQRVPVEVSSLPEAVLETIQEEYEDYRISEAFLVMGNGEPEVEGVVSEQTQRTEKTETHGAERSGTIQSSGEGSFYEIILEKDQETKTVKLKADGKEMNKNDKENIYVKEKEEEEEEER